MRDGGRAEAFFENQSRMPWRGAGAFLAQLGRWIVPSAQKGLAGPQLASVLQVKYDTTGGKRCAAAQSRTQGSPFTTNPTGRPVLGRVCSTNCVTTSSCTREQPRGSVHLIRHLASRLRRLAPSVTELHVGHQQRGE